MKRVLVLMGILALLLFPPSSIAVTEEIVLIDSYSFQTGQTDGAGLIDNHPSDSVYRSAFGQTFRPSQDYKSTKHVVFNVYRIGSPTVSITAVMSNSDGNIATTELFRSVNSIDATTLPVLETRETDTFIFSDSGTALSKDVWYAVEIQVGTGTIDTSNLIRVEWHTLSPTHQGNGYQYVNGAYSQRSEDAFFQIYGVPASSGGGVAGGMLPSASEQPIDATSTLPIAGGTTLLLIIGAIGAVYFLGRKGRGRII